LKYSATGIFPPDLSAAFWVQEKNRNEIRMSNKQFLIKTDFEQKVKDLYKFSTVCFGIGMDVVDTIK
jgi:hypothetical protein